MWRMWWNVIVVCYGAKLLKMSRWQLWFRRKFFMENKWKVNDFFIGVSDVSRHFVSARSPTCRGNWRAAYGSGTSPDYFLCFGLYFVSFVYRPVGGGNRRVDVDKLKCVGFWFIEFYSRRWCCSCEPVCIRLACNWTCLALLWRVSFLVLLVAGCRLVLAMCARLLAVPVLIGWESGWWRDLLMTASPPTRYLWEIKCSSSATET